MEMLIDTHAHIDGEEFKDDLPEVIERAKAAGIGKIFVPAINLQGMDNLLAVCHKYPGYAYPMIGLHPEDVKDDYLEVCFIVLPATKKRLQNYWLSMALCLA